jgi:hypothetical protein
MLDRLSQPKVFIVVALAAIVMFSNSMGLNIWYGACLACATWSVLIFVQFRRHIKGGSNSAYPTVLHVNPTILLEDDIEPLPPRPRPLMRVAEDQLKRIGF